MSQKSGFLIVSNGFFIENVGHTLTKNYNGTYWPSRCAFCSGGGVLGVCQSVDDGEKPGW